LAQERERSRGLDRDLAAAREEISKLKDAQGGAARQVSAAAAEVTQERALSQGLDRDLASAREEIRELKDAQGIAAQQVSATAAQLAQERKRSQALDRELVAAREEISTVTEKRTVIAHQSEAAPQSSAAEGELARERARSEALHRDLAAAREEIRMLTARHREATEQASSAAQALEQERSRSQRLDRDLATARQEISWVKAATARIVAPDTAMSHPKDPQNIGGEGGSQSSSEAGAAGHAPVGAMPETKTAVAATPQSKPPHRAEQDKPNPPTNEDKLLARARALVLQGNIEGARLWLERALVTGSARAAFDLAETYDPHVLSSLRTYGVRADPAKARELYSRAYISGIPEAKERIEALE
jgi:hypothetical protein